MKKATAKTTKLEDLDYSDIQQLPEKQKYILIRKQILSLKAGAMNALDLVPDGGRHTKLFSSLNLILLHARTAEREIQQIIKDLK